MMTLPSSKERSWSIWRILSSIKSTALLRTSTLAKGIRWMMGSTRLKESTRNALFAASTKIFAVAAFIACSFIGACQQGPPPPVIRFTRHVAAGDQDLYRIQLHGSTDMGDFDFTLTQTR